MMMTPTFEFVVPVRPGDHDRHPPAFGEHKEVVSEDGNLSKVYYEAIRDSGAAIVVLKHDDLKINDEGLFRAVVTEKLRDHSVVGVAGSTKLADHWSWWRNGEGTTRGSVAHRIRGTTKFSFYGPPGPVAVLDGCILAVRRNAPGVLESWDLFFKRDFYDIAFTANMTHLYRIRGEKVPPCYAATIDVEHDSIGMVAAEYEETAQKYVQKYRKLGVLPLEI